MGSSASISPGVRANRIDAAAPTPPGPPGMPGPPPGPPPPGGGPPDDPPPLEVFVDVEVDVPAIILLLCLVHSGRVRRVLGAVLLLRLIFQSLLKDPTTLRRGSVR